MPIKKPSTGLHSKQNKSQKKVRVPRKKEKNAEMLLAGNKIKSERSSSQDIDKILHKVRPSGKREESFFELVYEVARQIPYGRVTSYGAIAACLGTKLSARMVGWAMNGADKINPSVPAHRVVNRVGLLSGKHHFKPPGKMEKLLKKEGVLVKDDIIVNFKEKFWDPSKEEA